MMTSKYPVRLLAVGTATLLLAVLLGLQSLSTIAQRAQPQFASQIDPGNGKALSKHAFLKFSEQVESGADVGEAARSVAPLAKRAYQHHSLDPRALSLLTMAQDDQAKQQAILTQALRLNRRSLNLQALALQNFVGRGDLTQAIEVLDQLLRVHPEHREEFFPVLAQALTETSDVDIFVDMLSAGPPWRDPFLLYVSSQQNTLERAAQLRRQIDAEDPRIDFRLISNLAQFVGVDPAREHYQFASEQQNGEANTKWPSTFPPFDWKFANDRNLRAQLSRDGEEVELLVKSGAGGLVMERYLEAPQRRFDFTIETDLGDTIQQNNLRAQIICAESRTVLLDEPITEPSSQFEIQPSEELCTVVKLGLYARVFRGQPDLRAAVRSISFVTN